MPLFREQEDELTINQLVYRYDKMDNKTIRRLPVDSWIPVPDYSKSPMYMNFYSLINCF